MLGGLRASPLLQEIPRLGFGRPGLFVDERPAGGSSPGTQHGMAVAATYGERKDK